MGDKLSSKQERFRDEYLLDFNITQAYLRAGYKAKNENSAGAAGKRLFETPKMQKAIQEKMKLRQEKFDITEDKVIQEIACIAFSNISDYLKVEDISIGKSEDGEKDLYEQIVKIYTTDGMDRKKTAAIAGIKQTKHGIELKLHDKVTALTLLCKHFGILTDKLDLSGNINNTHMELTKEELEILWEEYEHRKNKTNINE